MDKDLPASPLLGPSPDDGLSIHSQLELFGIDSCIEFAFSQEKLPEKERVKLARRYEVAQRTMLEITPDEVAFLHAGLCQTGLPHSRPANNWEPWQRSNGRFHLVVEPGTLVDKDDGKARHVGVPYGTKGRLIFMHVNTEGVKSKTVRLGKSMTAYMKRLGLHVSGGKNGTIDGFKEQTIRLGRARFSFQFEGGQSTGVTDVNDIQVADKLHLWVTDENAPWLEEIELTDKFREHLKSHAVPLNEHAISSLSDSCLKLDFYAWAAWRLPQLKRPLRLNWHQLWATFASQDEPKRLAERLRRILPDVHDVYRDMNVEIVRGGMRLYPSKPPILKTLVAVSGPPKAPTEADTDPETNDDDE